MKFYVTSVLLLNSALGATTPGHIEDIVCAKCKCEDVNPSRAGSDLLPVDVDLCKEKCQELKDQYGVELPIWKFYEFLVAIGPQCRIDASGPIPIEIEHGDWCEAEANKTTEIDAQKGWVMKVPSKSNESTPQMQIERLNRGVTFRFWQKDASKWFCPPNEPVSGSIITTTQLGGDKVKCPVPEKSITWKKALGFETDKQYIEVQDTSLDATKDVFYTVKMDQCFGTLTKIEAQMMIEGTFTGMDKLPTTTPPSDFQKGGVLSSFAIPAASAIVLAYLSI